MRRNPALKALFPTVRAELLAATLTQPDKWWYLSELAQFLGTSPSSLQRELRALVDGGILNQRREGTRTYFKADTRSPLFPDLHGLLDKTAGIFAVIRAALAPFEREIECAFVYGSIARAREHALSDVDVMVIGSVGLAQLSPVLLKSEGRLGREINVTSYSVAEFRKKVVARKDHFVSEVLKEPKEFVKGEQRDLDRVIGKR